MVSTSDFLSNERPNQNIPYQPYGTDTTSHLARAGSANPSEAVSAVGDEAFRIGSQYLEQKQALEDYATIFRQSSEADVTLRKFASDLAMRTPPDGAGLSKGIIDKAGELLDAYTSNAPNDRVRLGIQKTLRSYFKPIIDTGLTHEASLANEYTKDSILSAQTARLNAVREDPLSVSDTVNVNDALLDSGDLAGRLSPGLREALKGDFRQRAYLTSLASLANDKPEVALKKIEEGVYNNDVAPADIQRLKNLAGKNLNDANYIERNRAETQFANYVSLVSSGGTRDVAYEKRVVSPGYWQDLGYEPQSAVLIASQKESVVVARGFLNAYVADSAKSSLLDDADGIDAFKSFVGSPEMVKAFDGGRFSRRDFNDVADTMGALYKEKSSALDEGKPTYDPAKIAMRGIDRKEIDASMAKGPAGFQALIGRSVDIQRSVFQVPETSTRVMDIATAKQMASRWNSLLYSTDTPNLKHDFLQNMKEFQRQYGPYADRAMGELVENGLNGGVSMLAYLARIGSVPSAFDQAIDAIKLRPSTIKGLKDDPEKVKLVNQMIDNKFSGFLKSISGGQTDRIGTLDQWKDVYRDVALSRIVVNDDSPNEAVNKTYDLFVDKLFYVPGKPWFGDRPTYVVPRYDGNAPVDTDGVRKGLGAILKDKDFLKKSGLTSEDLLKDISSNGHWVNSPDLGGVVLFNRNNGMSSQNLHVEFKWKDVLAYNPNKNRKALVKADALKPEAARGFGLYKETLPSELIPETGTFDPATFGTREDGTPKGLGWLGPILYRGKDAKPGTVMTELASTFDIDGKRVDIPLLVPSLTSREVVHLAYGGAPTDEIINKAVTFARQRIKSGKSPFIQPGETSGNPLRENSTQIPSVGATGGNVLETAPLEDVPPPLKISPLEPSIPAAPPSLPAETPTLVPLPSLDMKALDEWKQRIEKAAEKTYSFGGEVFRDFKRSAKETQGLAEKAGEVAREKAKRMSEGLTKYFNGLESFAGRWAEEVLRPETPPATNPDTDVLPTRPLTPEGPARQPSQPNQPWDIVDNLKELDALAKRATGDQTPSIFTKEQMAIYRQNLEGLKTLGVNKFSGAIERLPQEYLDQSKMTPEQKFERNKDAPHANLNTVHSMIYALGNNYPELTRRIDPMTYFGLVLHESGGKKGVMGTSQYDITSAGLMQVSDEATIDVLRTHPKLYPGVVDADGNVVDKGAFREIRRQMQSFDDSGVATQLLFGMMYVDMSARVVEKYTQDRREINRIALTGLNIGEPRIRLALKKVKEDGEEITFENFIKALPPPLQISAENYYYNVVKALGADKERTLTQNYRENIRDREHKKKL